MLTENFPLRIVGVKRDCRIDAPPYLNGAPAVIPADDYLGALFRGSGNDEVLGEGDDESASRKSASCTDSERSLWRMRQRRNSFCGVENENDSSGRFVPSASSTRLQLEERLTTYLMAPSLSPNQENEDPTEPFRLLSWPAPVVGREEAPSYAMDAFRPVKGSPLKRKLRSAIMSPGFSGQLRRSDGVDSPVRMDSFSGEADLPAQEWHCPPASADSWVEGMGSSSCYSSARSAKGDRIRYLTRQHLQQATGFPDGVPQQPRGLPQDGGRRHAASGGSNRSRPSILDQVVQYRWLSSARFESCSDLWVLAKAIFVLAKFHCSKCGVHEETNEQHHQWADAPFPADAFGEDAAVALVNWDALKFCSSEHVAGKPSGSAVSRGWPPRSVDGTTATMSTLKATLVLLAFIYYLQQTESQRKPEPQVMTSSCSGGGRRENARAGPSKLDHETGGPVKRGEVPFSSTLNTLAAALSFQGQLNHQFTRLSGGGGGAHASLSPPSSILANNTSSLYTSCCTLPGFNLYAAKFNSASENAGTGRPEVPAGKPSKILGDPKTLRSSNCSTITTVTTASSRSSIRRLSLSTTSSRESHVVDDLEVRSSLQCLHPAATVCCREESTSVLAWRNIGQDPSMSENGASSPSSSFFSSSPSQNRRGIALSQTAPDDLRPFLNAHRCSDSLLYSAEYLGFVRGKDPSSNEDQETFFLDSVESEKDSTSRSGGRPSSSTLLTACSSLQQQSSVEERARQAVPQKQFGVWKGRCARLLLEVKSGTQRSLQPLTHRFSQYMKSNGSVCPGQNGSVRQTQRIREPRAKLLPLEDELAGPFRKSTAAQKRGASDLEGPAVVCQARDCGAILAMIQRFCCALFVASAWIDEQEPLSTAVLSEFLGNAFSVLDGLKPCLQQGSLRSWSSKETIPETISSLECPSMGSNFISARHPLPLPFTSPNYPSPVTHGSESSLCSQSTVGGSKTAQLKKFAAATASSLYSSVTSSCLSRGGESFLIRDSTVNHPPRHQQQQQQSSLKNTDFFGPNGNTSACVICADSCYKGKGSHFGQPSAPHHHGLGKDPRLRVGTSSDRPNASPGGIIPGRETAVKRFGATSIDFERNLFCLLASINYRLQISPQSLRIVRRNMLETLAIRNPGVHQLCNPNVS